MRIEKHCLRSQRQDKKHYSKKQPVAFEGLFEHYRISTVEECVRLLENQFSRALERTKHRRMQGNFVRVIRQEAKTGWLHWINPGLGILAPEFIHLELCSGFPWVVLCLHHVCVLQHVFFKESLFPELVIRAQSVAGMRDIYPHTGSLQYMTSGASNSLTK